MPKRSEPSRRIITKTGLLLLGSGLVLLGLYFFVPTTRLRLDPLVRKYVPPEATRTEQVKEVDIPRIRPHLLPASTVTVPIIFYHYLEYNHDPKDTIRASLTVTPYWFEQQLIWLKTNGFTSIGLDELREAIFQRQALPQKPIIITFDDGYRDFYTDAYPLLKKYRVKAASYIVPGFINGPNYMTAEMIKEIATQSADLITLGAHTLHHVNLRQEKPQKAWEEISGSKQALEVMTGQAVRHFAYPYGSFSAEVERLVSDAGFVTAVTTVQGKTENADNIFYLPRIRVGNYAGEQFMARLASQK